jgi:hypothetical protein
MPISSRAGRAGHRGRASRSLWPGAILLLSLLTLTAPRAHAQGVSGLVAEQGTFAAVSGAVVSLLAPAPDGDGLVTVAVTRTDEEGFFSFDIPARGEYRVQADWDGYFSPLSEPLELGPGTDGTDDVALLVPSRLLVMAYQCQAEVGDDFVTIVGVVREPEGDVVIPEAQMEARWMSGNEMRILRVQADAAGRYRICGVPPNAGFVQLQAELLGRRGPMEEIEVQRPTLVFHDPVVTLAAARDTRTGAGNVVQERILLEAQARTLADLTGELLDQLTGTPIPQAVVRINGTPYQALTGADGRFTFEGIQPGVHALDIRHLGYAVASEPVEVPAGRDVFVRLRVAPQAVLLEGIQVTTRSAVEELSRLSPFRRDIVYGEAMAEEELRGARAFEILRRGSPGLQVREVYMEGQPPMVCVQTNRRVQSFRSSDGCDMVQVIMDGVRLEPGSASDLLRTLPATEIESVEFLPPSEATIRYGTGGSVSNGVVVIYTRGRGPYASPLRDRRPE